MRGKGYGNICGSGYSEMESEFKVKQGEYNVLESILP